MHIFVNSTDFRLGVMDELLPVDLLKLSTVLPIGISHAEAIRYTSVWKEIFVDWSWLDSMKRKPIEVVVTGRASDRLSNVRGDWITLTIMITTTKRLLIKGAARAHERAHDGEGDRNRHTPPSFVRPSFCEVLTSPLSTALTTLEIMEADFTTMQ